MHTVSGQRVAHDARPNRRVEHGDANAVIVPCQPRDPFVKRPILECFAGRTVNRPVTKCRCRQRSSSRRRTARVPRGASRVWSCPRPKHRRRRVSQGHHPRPPLHSSSIHHSCCGPETGASPLHLQSALTRTSLRMFRSDAGRQAIPGKTGAIPCRGLTRGGLGRQTTHNK